MAARPRDDNRSRVVAVDPGTMAIEALFEVDDHVGAVVDGGDRLHLATWGSRRWLTAVDGRVVATAKNPTHACDFQDGQAIGDGLAVCTGIVELAVDGRIVELGGVALVRPSTGEVLHEVPVLARSPGGHVITRNPTWLELVDGTLRMTCVPDDGAASLLVYEAAR